MPNYRQVFEREGRRLISLTSMLTVPIPHTSMIPPKTI